MKTPTARISRLAVLALSAFLAATPTLADKGGKHGNNNNGNGNWGKGNGNGRP